MNPGSAATILPGEVEKEIPVSGVQRAPKGLGVRVKGFRV